MSDELQPPSNPESIRDAKGWLSARMPDSTYKETRDQAALASRFDMAAARDASALHYSDSFDKFWRECEKLFR